MTPTVEGFLRGPGQPGRRPTLAKFSESVIGTVEPSKTTPGAVEPGTTADGAGLDIDLDGCFAKLARAQEHLKAIDEALRTFFETDPYGAVGKIEGEHGWYVFRVEVRREPPLRIGILMGEYAHQVRSAFDHFVWALAWRHRGKKPPEKIGFPIDTSESKYTRKATKRLEGHVPDDWTAFIEALQPYHAEDDPLAVLERFWNRDKHQTLVPLPSAEASMLPLDFRPTRQSLGAAMRTRAGVRLVEGAELGRLRLPPADSQAQVDMYVSVALDVMGEGADGGRFFWDLFGSEDMLRMILSAFPTGQRSEPVFRPTGNYGTIITTAPDAAAAEALGFTVTRLPL